MIPFKRAFIEGLLAEAEMPAGYKNPTPKATFQLDDIVLVRPGGSNIKEMQDYFEGLQPKKYYRYFNNVGKVIGYKPGAMSAKFAVEFSDGTIGSFNTAHLKGPFVSSEAAEIAAKQHTNDFPPEASSKFVHRDERIPTNIPLEDYFKYLFVNSSGGFKWLDTPIVIPMIKDLSNLRLVILAHKPHFINQEEFRHAREWEKHVPAELKSSFLFFKIFNDVTGKFANVTSFDVNLWTVRMPITNPRTGYFMQLPTFSNSDYSIKSASEEQNFQQSLCISTMPVNRSFEKHLNLVVSNFEKAKKLSKITTFEEYFDIILYNAVERDGVKTITNKEVHINLKSMPAKFDLSKYKIKGSVVMDMSNNFLNCPTEVTGDFTIRGLDLTLKDLIGLPKTGGKCSIFLSSLNSLEGCPSEINSDFKIHLHGGSLSNLKFFPKHIKGECYILTKVTSFKGGEDCVIDGTLWVNESCKDLNGLPKATAYELEGIHQNEIDNYFKLKKITTRLPELDGMF